MSFPTTVARQRETITTSVSPVSQKTTILSGLLRTHLTEPEGLRLYFSFSVLFTFEKEGKPHSDTPHSYKRQPLIIESLLPSSFRPGPQVR